MFCRASSKINPVSDDSLPVPSIGLLRNPHFGRGRGSQRDIVTTVAYLSFISFQNIRPATQSFNAFPLTWAVLSVGVLAPSISDRPPLLSIPALIVAVRLRSLHKKPCHA